MTSEQRGAGGWLAALSDDLTAVAERLREGVVEVRSHNHGGGAGTIWRGDGLIVTNHHVAPRDEAIVTLRDGREFTAPAVARDAENDIAVLRVPVTGLKAAPRGDSRAVRPGQLVLAVGHPFGVRGSVSAGVVSATPISAPAAGGEREFIRADVLLGPGNSGGPLADALGRVIGINAMAAGGLALAVPAHIVERLLGQRSDRRRLGVVVREAELSPALRSAAGVDATRALLVVGVREGSPAARAGVIPGDLLLALNEIALTETQALLHAIASSSADTAAVRLLRGGRLQETAVPFVESGSARAA